MSGWLRCDGKGEREDERKRRKKMSGRERRKGEEIDLKRRR